MRFLHLSTAYHVYLAKFYAARPGLAEAGSEEQRRALHADAFGWADFWSHYLGARGIEAEDRLVNARPAQFAWAREHDVAVEPGSWLPQIAAAQVRAFAPDVLFLEDYAVFPGRWVAELRAQLPSLRLVVAWCGAPYEDASFFNACDLVLSCIPELVADFRSRGHRSELLRHGFDARVLERIGGETGAPRYPVSFVGSAGLGSAAHAERERLLARVAERYDLAVFTPAADRTPWQRAKTALKSALGRGGVPLTGKLRRALRPGVFGLDMFRTLRASSVTLNSHISISANSASNMRLFEATGVGTCLLTDWKADLPGLFKADAELVAYRSADECLEKIDFLLRNPAERARIGAAGQARTLRDHTIEARAADMEAILRRQLQ